MAVKRFKPITPGTRFKTVSSFEEVTKSKPEKSLLVALRHTAGRNNYGRITVRQHGGGNKTKYRIIDFKRNKDDIPAKVAAIEYDPNRTAYIALLHYVDGEKRYILAPVGLTVGDMVMSGNSADIKAGNALPLSEIPVGTLVHNIEMQPGKGGQIAKTAGAAAQLMAKEGKYATLKLPSGEMRYILARCKATVGQVGNLDHELISLGKKASYGQTSRSARCCNEPERPPSWRRRRQVPYRQTYPRYPLGRTYAWLQDQKEA